MTPRQVTITLNKPHAGQQVILSGAKRFNAVCCGRRFGKSALAENLLIEPALHKFPTGYFTPTYKLLEGTYNQCVYRLGPLVSRKNNQQFIELITGGRIDFWTLEDELAGRSRKYKRIIVDEAAFINKLWKRWTESLRATLSDYQGDAWFFSTPKGKNDFYKLHQQHLTKSTWASFQMPTSSNPYIDASEIEDARSDMPVHAFEQEYEAKFIDDNIAIFRNIEARINNQFSRGTRHFIGIDIGRVNDFTVITILNEKCQMVFQDAIRHQDWSKIVDWICKNVKRYENPLVAVERNGVGDPIVEQVTKALPGITVYGVDVTGHNKQSLIEDLVVAFDNSYLSILNIEALKGELENFTYLFDPKTRRVKYGAPAGLHDDRVMSLAHAYNCFKTKRSYGQY